MTTDSKLATTRKEGRSSRFLPPRLLTRYEEGLRDPDLLALRSELALLDSRMAEVLRSIEEDEPDKKWSEIQELIFGIKRQIVLGRVEDADRIAETLQMALRRGERDHNAWETIERLIEARRRTAEVEIKRLSAMQGMITAEQALALLGAILESIRHNVSNPVEVAALAADLEKLADYDPAENQSQ